MSQQRIEARWSVARGIVIAAAFIFWGIVQFWAIWVAIFGGTYPWPASLFMETSSGGNWLAAVILFFVGGLLVGGTILIFTLFEWGIRTLTRTLD